jgi:hypothetical protein
LPTHQEKELYSNQLEKFARSPSFMFAVFKIKNIISLLFVSHDIKNKCRLTKEKKTAYYT